MPELPEVEVLVRHLRPLLQRRTIRRVEIRRLKTLNGTDSRTYKRILTGSTFVDLQRRGKYLLFHLRPSRPSTINQSGPSTLNSLSRRSQAKADQPPVRHGAFDEGGSTVLLGHLGMTGRMYLLPAIAPLPRHAAVVLHLDRRKLVFEDTRYFGRLTLDTSPLERLGPEPLDGDFTPAVLRARLLRSRQPIKMKLLDQAVVAGVGNIYASEALFRARISPRTPAGKLHGLRLARLCATIRQVLREAIAAGSTVPLNFAGQGKRDGLFYYGSAPDTPQYYEERLLVYDRQGRPCPRCRTLIRRITQSARSTYFCPKCQRR